MIFSRLDNSHLFEKLNPDFNKAFSFLKNTDLKALPDGRYDIDGDKIFVNVQSLKTKNKIDKKWEAHKKYIDIQYIIKGSECMGYGLLEDFKTIDIPYNEDKDIIFYKDDTLNYNYINMKEGDFIIFYPFDVHAPMLAVKGSEDIKKLIVKIKID